MKQDQSNRETNNLLRICHLNHVETYLSIVNSVSSSTYIPTSEVKLYGIARASFQRAVEFNQVLVGECSRSRVTH